MKKTVSALVLVVAALGTYVFVADAQFEAEFPTFAGMTKQQVAQQIRAQDFILSDAQIQQAKKFLATYEVQPSDVRFLKQVAEANGFKYENIKDTAFVQRLVASSTLSIDDAVVVLDSDGKNIIKQDRILRLKKFLPYTDTTSNFDIQITDIEAIPDGVAVFIRAFLKDGTQIGFGIDGTVDIERVQILNPAALVEDPSGTIEREYYTIDPVTGEREGYHTKKYREDLRAAMVADLERAINNQLTLGVSGEIVPGSVGETTTTVRPEAGSSVNDTDTSVWTHPSQSSTFSGLRTQPSAYGNNITNTVIQARLRSNVSGGSNGWWGFYRPILGFNTSAVGSDTVSAATLTLTGDGFAQDAFNLDTVIDIANPPSGGGAYALSDYALANFDGVDQAPRKDITNDYDDSGSNDFVLNSTGLGNINGSGVTFFAPRTSADVDDVEPTWVSNSSSYFRMYSADETGTTNDPVLVITHTAGTAPVQQKQDVIWFQ